jgi:pilus assembly protein CpaB
MRRLVLPLIALTLAAGATFTVRSYLDRGPQPTVTRAETPSRPNVKSVLVAAGDLAPGSFVQPDSLRWQDWPDVELPESYLVQGGASEADLVGAVVRRSIAAGEPLSMTKLVKPGERGFLAAVLDPGMRAVTVAVDEASSNAGLIFPGDRVDLIVTHEIQAGVDQMAPRRVSETVLEDVRIIAMGGRLRTESEAGDGMGAQARTATLETSPEGAEKVALVAELGRLSLSLRSLAMAEDATVLRQETLPLTWDVDASPALRPENQPHSTLSVIRGGKAETVSVRRGAGT